MHIRGELTLAFTITKVFYNHPFAIVGDEGLSGDLLGFNFFYWAKTCVHADEIPVIHEVVEHPVLAPSQVWTYRGKPTTSQSLLCTTMS